MSALPKRPWQEPSQICVTEDSVEALYEKEKIRREPDGEKGFNTEEGRRRVSTVLCAGPVEKPCSPRGAHADPGAPPAGGRQCSRYRHLRRDELRGGAAHPEMGIRMALGTRGETCCDWWWATASGSR
jgi:hypothetical protein